MTMLIVGCGRERKDRASSIQDISSAIAVLDRIMTIIVIIASGFIYAIFFSKTLVTKSIQLWASVSGLSFMIGGTVTEFIACCIFLFVKHPYDVGDRINITNPQMEESELVVKHISLMYTIFNRVDNEAIVQIPHNVANKFWIENITRSKAMKERISLCVSYLTSMEDILTLRQEMEHFVTAPENSHDFLPDFDIELQTIQDLRSLELRIEIRHKSNWASDKVRLHRRNKFLCELLEALRRVGIERPGDTPGPDNPSYVVELRNDETMEFKKEKQEKVKERKIKQGRVTLEEVLPTGLNAAQEMFPGLKKRSVLEQEQGRRPSMWSPI